MFKRFFTAVLFCAVPFFSTSGFLHAATEIQIKTEDIHAQLHNEDGKPIVGASIKIISASNFKGPLWKKFPVEVTDAEGRFRFHDLPENSLCIFNFSHWDYYHKKFHISLNKKQLTNKKKSVKLHENGSRIIVHKPRNVRIKLLDHNFKTPLAGVIINAYNEQYGLSHKKPTTFARTDKNGFARLSVPPGQSWLTLGDDKELDCIGLHEKEIIVHDVKHQQDFVRATQRGCQLTFKIINIETGYGIPNVYFSRENSYQEMWEKVLVSENIGDVSKYKIRSPDNLNPEWKTDDSGTCRFLLHPLQNYEYFVKVPKGYEVIGNNHFRLNIPFDGEIEKIVRVRRKLSSENKNLTTPVN